MDKFKRIKKRNVQVSKIRTWLARNKELPPMALRVMILWLEEPDWRQPAHKEYAKLLNTSPKVIQRAYRKLLDMQILDRVTGLIEGGCDHRTPSYQISEELLRQVFRKFKEWE